MKTSNIAVVTICIVVSVVTEAIRANGVPCKNTTMADASGQCVPCPAGKACFVYKNRAMVETCKKGYFSRGSADRCYVCSSGQYTDTEGAGTCLRCPAGQACSKVQGVQRVESCLKGYFSKEGASDCTKCGEGQYTEETGSTVCESCPEGKACYLSQGVQIVESCKNGTYSPGNSTKCLQCPLGKYTTDDEAAECMECPEGYSCRQINGELHVEICPVGTYSDGYCNTCNPCQNGTYNVKEGSTECQICPAGKACLNINGVQSIETCQIGTFAPEGSSTCRRCNGGTYNRRIGSERCLKCPIGKACFVENNIHHVQTCKNGTYSIGETSSCEIVSEGYYTAREGAGTYQKCLPGYSCFQSNHVQYVAPCKIGTYSTGGAHTCTDCSYEYCTNGKGSTHCFPCSIINVLALLTSKE